MSDSGVRRKFSWGVSFNGIWWSFVLVCAVCDVIFMFPNQRFTSAGGVMQENPK